MPAGILGKFLPAAAAAAEAFEALNVNVATACVMDAYVTSCATPFGSVATTGAWTSPVGAVGLTSSCGCFVHDTVP